jgi:5-deoxy-glucuronate isomerase
MPMNDRSLIYRQQRHENGLLVAASPADVGWSYLHVQVYRLTAGQSIADETADRETALVVLGGHGRVLAGDRRFERVGERETVWTRQPPHAVLLPPGEHYTVEALDTLHLAVAAAPAPPGGEARLISPRDVVAEERGSGQTYRYIHHILPPSAPAARLILVEVYTPGGNWSSFPPHKHDTEDPPRESYLEETYYYQVMPPTGFAVQRIYTPDRSLDVTMAPGDGDLVVVPRGYHPVGATPGHDCYYLNAMAGPSRAWNFQVDPDYQHLMNWQKPDVAR